MSENRWSDPEAKHGLHKSSVLLNRERRDLLAKIAQDSIEPFSHHYMDCHRANELEKLLDLEEGREPQPVGKRIADSAIAWADEILVLSASGGGWRAIQVEKVERGSDDAERDEGDLMDSRGLKHRE